jgi:hypothetical protein
MHASGFLIRLSQMEYGSTVSLSTQSTSLYLTPDKLMATESLQLQNLSQDFLGSNQVAHKATWTQRGFVELCMLVNAQPGYGKMLLFMTRILLCTFHKGLAQEESSDYSPKK